MKKFFLDIKNVVILVLSIVVIYHFVFDSGDNIEVNRLEQRIERYEQNKMMYERRIDSLSTENEDLTLELDTQKVITDSYITKIDSLKVKYEKDIDFDNVSDDELVTLFSEL